MLSSSTRIQKKALASRCKLDELAPYILQSWKQAKKHRWNMLRSWHVRYISLLQQLSQLWQFIGGWTRPFVNWTLQHYPSKESFEPCILSPQCIDIVFSAYHLMFSITGCYHKSSMESQCFDQAIMEGVARASAATSASGGIHWCCEVRRGVILFWR